MNYNKLDYKLKYKLGSGKMARETMDTLREEIKSLKAYNKRLESDNDSLKQQMNEIKADKNMISMDEHMIEYNQLMSQLNNEKIKNITLTKQSNAWKQKYNELFDKQQIKNDRGAGRKPFNDEDTVKRIYNLYLNGMSLKNIAEDLNKDSSQIKNWSKSSVRIILLNNKNIELGFISEDDYNKIIELMRKNRKNKHERNI